MQNGFVFQLLVNPWMCYLGNGPLSNPCSASVPLRGLRGETTFVFLSVLCG